MKIYKKKYIVTSALPYTNGYIHIGHLSGVFIPADIYVRYLKIINKKVLFISGSDENGSSIIIKSIKKKKKIKFLINKYHKYIKKYLKIFNISLDNYFRTSNKLHHKISKKIFKKFFLKGLFFLKKTKQYYDKYYKQFLADRYVIGECPICHYKKTFSDQCEKCGNIIKDNNIINPISILSKKKPIKKKTYNLYISLYKYNDLIKKFLLILKKNKNKKNIINNIKFFLKKKINIKSITRDLKWGVKLPIKNKKLKNKVIYVWFESLIGYISSTINYDKKNNTKWYKYWFNKKTKLVNFIGKDNIFFHSILLPIILKNYNNKLILPNYISANEFLNLEGKKISTSKKWAIWLHKYVKYFPNMEDSLRFSLIMDMPENKDTNFTWKKFQLYNNTILIGKLGNFINRVIVILKKDYNSIIPKYKNLNKKNIKFLNKIFNYPNKIFNLIKKFKFKKSLYKFIKFINIGNKYLSLKKPWEIKNKIKKNNILYIISQLIGLITYLSYIFLPKTNKKLLNIININIKKINIKKIIKNKCFLKPCHKIITNNILLFKKINNYKINKLINKLKIKK
ncbi:MAG: methionine--tRNA ligase [Candidatus Shikimatogenerans bostrichidophilus]|nr:MAG: methionine--tRNA ligase [Candidatus Shikimatogenerans bostrichidophilus]